MPYISHEARQHIDNGFPPANVGELTYALTLPIRRYLRFRPAKFSVYAEVLAALASVANEFKRRVLDPYEDMKCAENGDCWDDIPTRS